MKKYFRIAIRDTHPVLFFDVEAPADAQLPRYWSNIKIEGSIITENFCVPYDMIAHISIVTIEEGQTTFRPRVVN